MGVNSVGKHCENPIHFARIFIVQGFFWPKILEINRALSKLFMHMETHFPPISSYRDLSLYEFKKLATLMPMLVYSELNNIIYMKVRGVHGYLMKIEILKDY